MSIELIILLVLIIVVIAYLVLIRTGLGCILIKSGPELIRCLIDEESREGLKALMDCGNKNSERIKQQVLEFKDMRVPGDSDICSARCLDEYPTPQLAAFSKKVTTKCNHAFKKDDIVPTEFVNFEGAPLPMDLNEHEGVWWRSYTNAWDSWAGSRLKFDPQENGDYHLHIEHQVKTAKRGLIRRTLVEQIEKEGITTSQFGTRLVMWGTETTEVWKLLYKTEDVRAFAICATTEKPRLRIDSIVLVISREQEIKEVSLEKLKSAIEKRGYSWEHFTKIDNESYTSNLPVLPY
jgi:hypothetical protein